MCQTSSLLASTHLSYLPVFFIFVICYSSYKTTEDNRDFIVEGVVNIDTVYVIIIIIITNITSLLLKLCRISRQIVLSCINIDHVWAMLTICWLMHIYYICHNCCYVPSKVYLSVDLVD